MFDRTKFSTILKQINDTYDSMSEFGNSASFDRSYISKYINMKLEKPPSPTILRKIADASHGIATYMDLMKMCGYIDFDILSIKEELENRLALFNLTEDEYYSAINCFMTDSKKLQGLAFVLRYMPQINDEYIDKERQVLSTILDYVFIFIPDDLEIPNKKEILTNEKKRIEAEHIFYEEFDKALNHAKKFLLSLNKNKIISNTKQKEKISSAIVHVYGTIPAGIPMECIEDIIDTEEIPASWLKGGKQFFGLKIKGTSMFPSYLDGDTIILEKALDCENGQDCVVMVNGNDGTFKRVFKNENGIILQPLNPEFQPMVYSNEQIVNLPIKIIGIAREIRRKI